MAKKKRENILPLEMIDVLVANDQHIWEKLYTEGAAAPPRYLPEAA